jgi:PHS family inorganic phosphate transporter-like MFS transporter
MYGITVSKTNATQNYRAGIAFYALSEFLLNLWPNIPIFIMAAESFPTEFRGTCYGIAAAMGKLGAIIIRPIMEKVGKGRDGLIIMLSVFSVILFVMAILAWWEPLGIPIPPAQNPRPRD